MRVLLFGRTGQVARELVRRAPADIEIVALGRGDADLTAPDRCAARIAEGDEDIVVNSAAFTGVDAAESAPEAAHQVNALAPAAMAAACARRSVPFLHLSTDYVFDGSGDAPRRPEEPTAPLGVYGSSKRDGEALVLDADPEAVVLRTSWVFSAHGQNFVRTMLRLGRERDALRIVADQIGGPTAAADIADALFTIARRRAAGEGAAGIHHFAGAPAVSWAQFAAAIFEVAGLDVAIEAIPTSEYPTPARRPLNSRLDCSTTAANFGVDAPDWRAALHRVVTELESSTHD